MPKSQAYSPQDVNFRKIRVHCLRLPGERDRAGPHVHWRDVGVEIPMQPSDSTDIPQHPDRVANKINLRTRLLHPINWDLGHREQELARDEQDFDIKSEAHGLLPGKDRGSRLAAEHLEAALGVGNTLEGQ